MPTRNINLTDRLDDFVESNVSSGRYQNASEVVREGLRLLEQRQREDKLKLAQLRKVVRVGEDALDRGEYRDLEPSELGDFLAGLGSTARVRSRR